MHHSTPIPPGQAPAAPGLLTAFCLAGRLRANKLLSLLATLSGEVIPVSLAQKVEADLKSAVKSKDELARSCLRLVRAALQNKAKDLQRPLEEAEEIAVLSTLAKQRRESVEQFTKGGREDLAQREQAELELIEAYLPAQLDEAAIAGVLDEVFAAEEPQGMKDMGKVMKAAMAKLAGQADGKLVNQLVRQRLQSS